ncbi:MAG: hypothetical protein AB3N18_13100 [Allomuricauda sp.]
MQQHNLFHSEANAPARSGGTVGKQTKNGIRYIYTDDKGEVIATTWTRKTTSTN